MGWALNSASLANAMRWQAAASLTREPVHRAGGPVPPVHTTFNYFSPERETDQGLAQRERFEAQFHREMESVHAWSAQADWTLDVVPDLEVFVSTEYRISRALAHVWRGEAGRMEFPASRVVAGKAAIAHELVHVFLPNGNRFLAEGLAVYLQSEIGGNPAFPNFGRPLHELARERLQDMVPGFSPGDPRGLEPVRLAELDRIATPSPLTLTVGTDVNGEEPRGQARIYAVAGSFVLFLIETRGLDRFRTLYLQTPLVPFSQGAGTPARWLKAYDMHLADLEREWKSLMAGRGR